MTHLPARDIVFRHRLLILLITLLLFLALYPFLEQEVPEKLFSVFISVTLIAGTYVVSRDRRFLAAAVVLALGALASQWLTHFIDREVTVVLAHGSNCAFCVLITVAVLAAVVKRDEVTGDKICGAISGYLLMGMSWAFLYGLIEVLRPGSFLEAGQLIAPDRAAIHQFALMNSMLYYSLATLTTTTYGDILPKTTSARALSNLEGVAGQMYVAVLIARLVALHILYRFNSRPQTKD